MTNYLDNQLCFLLYVTSKEIIKKYTTLLKPYDLTYTGYITMMSIEPEEQVIVKELGQRLHLDSGTLTPLLKKLEAKGYINRTRAKHDERQMNVSLTEKGRDIRTQLPCVAEAVSKDMDITKEQFMEIKATLQQIVKTL
ncbi:MarR family winged helix-turn-helix transcriptional regulator [Kurthia massiliensis]|uniref:MarR family winged helix-turn-helix transcriptional regulator n=1 Tax=Kurthia massiliensis TaxID=1033739 RepID=UPI0002897BA9